MQTIKILGSGPLSGQTFYAELNAFAKDSEFVCMELDPVPSIFPDDWNGCCHFNMATRSMSHGKGIESDLLQIDSNDVSTLREMISYHFMTWH